MEVCVQKNPNYGDEKLDIGAVPSELVQARRSPKIRILKGKSGKIGILEEKMGPPPNLAVVKWT